MKTPAHNAAGRPTSRRGAFTTIEILIVVVILAITAAIAVPMVGNRSDIKLASAARKAVADLQYAQNLSIATRDSVYVRFDNDAYTLCKKVGASLTAISHPVDKTTFAVTLYNNPSSSSLRGVRLVKPSFGGNSVIGFDSIGAPFSYNEASGVRSTLAAQGEVRFTCGTGTQSIFVEPYTGEISVP